MSKKIVIKAFEEAGIKPDRFGNYVIEGKTKTFRFKLLDKAFRLERKNRQTSTWFNVFSNRTLYYSRYAEKVPELIKRAIKLSNE